jgi:hypothetical protein
MDTKRRVQVFAAILAVACGGVASCDQPAGKSVEKKLSGDLNLQAGAKNSGLRFRLINGTDGTVAFRGDGEKSEIIHPWDGTLECRQVGSSDWSQGVYALVDGGPASVYVFSGEELNLQLAFEHHHEFARQFPGGECRFNLRLEGGATLVSSSFQP